MDLDINIKEFNLKDIFHTNDSFDLERLEVFLDEVERYINASLLYRTPYDGIFYKMFLSTCIKYLTYSKTNKSFTIQSILEMATMVKKDTIFDWSKFDLLIYQSECIDDCVKLNILHEHNIFSMFYERCYYSEEFSFCLMESLLHTVALLFFKYNNNSSLEFRDELHSKINVLYDTAQRKDKHAFCMQCMQLLNKDAVRKS